MSTKTGICGCGQTVTIPKYQCIFQCHVCHNLSIFLCHIIPLPYDLKNLRCNLCDENYMMYTCPKCQSSSVIKNYRSGYIYNCLCGFQSNMISCNKCTSLLLLPTRKIYEQTKINCKNCQHVFKYFLCKSCKECNFYRPDQKAEDITYCTNPRCRKYRQQNPITNTNIIEKDISKSQKLPMQQNQYAPKANMIYTSNPYVTMNQPKGKNKQMYET